MLSAYDMKPSEFHYLIMLIKPCRRVALIRIATKYNVNTTACHIGRHSHRP